MWADLAFDRELPSALGDARAKRTAPSTVERVDLTAATG